MTEFNGVISTLAQALTKKGYETLTPVQKAVLAPELNNQDLLVSAQTGSGKTVAFGICLADNILNDDGRFDKIKAPQALVITPTRELALQVKTELEWLYKISGAAVSSCVGGMDIRAERRALERRPHIVVGTPGRLRDHIQRGSFDTSELKAVVLDEADEMLDMGFREELEYILDTTPKNRRTLMFSATVPKSIASLAKRYQRDAKRISTKEEEKQHVDIEYNAFLIAPNDRENAIINLLRYHEAKNTLVFCSTRAAVNLMTSRFTNRGFSVVALSGELNQNQRSQALQALRDGRAQVCVATDVAARGLDLPNLELVIHADLPRSKDLLLHRSGRTGRAGRKGISALIVPYNWRSRTERLLKSAKLKATWGKPPSIKDIADKDKERFLSDPSFDKPIKEDEKPLVQELTTKYSAEQLATALFRMYTTKKPAAEELLDAAPAEGGRKRRESFKDGVWVSLSIGRKDSAEPRWILPALCGAGHLTKKQIGSIRIYQTETHVELSPECAEDFFKHIGEKGEIEKNINATRLEGVPKEIEEEYSDTKKRSRNKRSNRKNRNDDFKGKHRKGNTFKDKNHKKHKHTDKNTGKNTGESKSYNKKDNKKNWSKKRKTTK